MSKLVIGKNGFSLPLTLVTSTQAILARKRSGKSYTASVQAEELLEASQQIVVIDPTSAWSGLRSSANGKDAGYSIVVFGGDHADAPLDFRAGKLMAQAIVEHGFSAIFDVGNFETDHQVQFVMDFCSELLRINRNAMHVFMDEADTFAPQQGSKLQIKCKGTVSRLVKQGGIKGVGFTMITQRSASLSWDVLSQVDILTILRMSAPHDINPVSKWLQSETTKEFASQVSEELPRLPVGVAFIASAPLDIAQRIEIRERRTFNSGATPKPGERKIEPKVLAQIDIQKLGEKIAASAEESKKNSPDFLKQRIAELEKSLVNQGKQSITPERERMLLEKIDGLQKLAKNYERVMEHVFTQSIAVINCMTSIRSEIESLKSDNAPMVEELNAAVGEMMDPNRKGLHFTDIAAPNLLYPTMKVPRHKPTDSVKLRTGAERMLAVIAQWYPNGRTEAQIAAQVQMKRTGGTWAAYKSDLKTQGYLDVRDGLWFATDRGVEYFGGDIPLAPSTTQEVCSLWVPKLRSGAVNMLQALVDRKGKPITREELGAAVGMEPRGGTFAAYLSDLKTAHLIVVDKGTVAANKETLFL